MKTQLSLLLTISLLMGCSTTQFNSDVKTAHSNQLATPSNNSAQVKILADGNLYYAGKINFAGYLQLIKHYQNSTQTRQPSMITIQSLGGDTFVGMAMGRFIKDKNLNITIDKYCFSACASYLFPAANNKYLNGSAIVAFHQPQLARVITSNNPKLTNSITKLKHPKTKTVQYKAKVEQYSKNDNAIIGCNYQADIKDHPIPLQRAAIIYEKAVDYCQHLLKQEQASFYDELALSPDWIAKGFPKLAIAQKTTQNRVKLYYYDLASLQQLGIKNIIVDKQWQPEKNLLAAHLVQVSLQDWSARQLTSL